MSETKTMYNVTLCAKAEPPKGKKRVYYPIGRAFDMPGGGISVDVSPGVTIDRHITENYYINLFPVKTSKSAGIQARTSDDSPPDDDIPF